MKNLFRIFISFAFLYVMASCEKDSQKEDNPGKNQLKTTETGVCTDETGWADGARYLTKGNWATFVKAPLYKDLGIPDLIEAPTVVLLAGQNKIAGTIFFYKGPGVNMITLKIRLEPCVSLRDVEEIFKVQGYTEAPFGIKPVPGQFITYKGNGTFNPVNNYYYFDVPYFAYFGIHVDLLYCCN
jgi:hypothetical protein